MGGGDIHTHQSEVLMVGEWLGTCHMHPPPLDIVCLKVLGQPLLVSPCSGGVWCVALCDNPPKDIPSMCAH